MSTKAGEVQFRRIGRDVVPHLPTLADLLAEAVREAPAASNRMKGITDAQRMAQQLAELLARHRVKAHHVTQRMREAGDPRPVSYTTLNRILNGETEPSQTTLRRVAAALGETYAEAFPEPGVRRLEQAIQRALEALARHDAATAEATLRRALRRE